MLLPAILSISIVGVPFLIISLWYYLSLQKQQKKEPGYEIANNIVIDQNGLEEQPRDNDIFDEKNQLKQIDNASEEQIIFDDAGVKRSIEPLKQSESNYMQAAKGEEQMYQKHKQQINPANSSKQYGQQTDKGDQVITNLAQSQHKTTNIPTQEAQQNQNSNHQEQIQRQQSSANSQTTVLNQKTNVKNQVQDSLKNSDASQQQDQYQTSRTIEQEKLASPKILLTPEISKVQNSNPEYQTPKDDLNQDSKDKQFPTQKYEGSSSQRNESGVQIQQNSEDQIIVTDDGKQKPIESPNQQEACQKPEQMYKQNHNHQLNNQEVTDNGNQAMTQSNQSSSKKKISILPSQGDFGVQYPSVIPDQNENSKKEYSTPGNQTTNPIPKHNHETPDGDPKHNPLKSNQLLQIKGNELQQQSLNQVSLQTNQQTLPANVIQNLRQEQTRLQPNYLQNQQNQQAVTIVTEQQSENDQRKNLKKYNRMQNIFLLISCIIFLQSIIGRIYVKNTKTKIEAPQFFILSAINAGFVIILYNFIYSGILCVMAICSVRAQEALIIARFCFVFYGLIMTFPIYAGLDDFITLDFITSIIAIIYSFIIQYPLMKIKVFCKWPTHIQFGTLQ